MDKVCLRESAREQASQMAYHNQDVEASTNAVKAKQVETCFNSGKEGHFVRDSKCPPRGRKCVKCDRYGHLARCCRGEKSGSKLRRDENG